MPEPYKYFRAYAGSRNNGARFVQVHRADFEARMLARDQHFEAAALAREVVPVVVLGILRDSDLPERDKPGEGGNGTVLFVLPQADPLLHVIHEQGVMNFGRADVQRGDPPATSGQPARARIPAHPIIDVDRGSCRRFAAHEAVLNGVPNVGPCQAVYAFPAKRLHQLHTTTGTCESVPVQTVLVKAVSGVDVGTEVKWTHAAEDQALFCEDAHCEVFFKRARSTRINPHAALSCWCSSREVWSGVPAVDDSRGHNLLSACHRPAQ